jgi:pyrroline-5-carboxylate reductase
MSTIAFLGAGNIANAIMGGLISDGHTLFAFDPIEDCRERARGLGVVIASSNTDAISKADIVMLCVKPDVVLELLDEISAASQGKLFISVAAGITTTNMLNRLPRTTALVRCMPNTPALVKTGMTALFACPSVTAEQKASAASVLASVGEVLWVATEAELDIVTAVSGSGPAYFFLLMESMINAGVAEGLSVAVSTQLVLQTALGAAVMAKQSDFDAGTLRKQVTSPGGTTQAAIEDFQSNNFEQTVSGAVNAARTRSVELSKN